MNHKLIEGDLLAREATFAIVVSRWNDLITRKLLEGALETIRRHGGSEENVSVVWVPGSFELPLVADRLAKSGRYQAVCCLGAVIQGSTMHHDYINHQVAAGIMRSGQESGVPVLFGVLTCETMEQALDRAGGKVGNKGCEAALAAIEMVNLLKTIDQDSQ
ncbi:6,7-dimethyl-8-ribityllumazine synthase [Gimesia aquarii]|uniref:6,7-dimethyl-8-ribityllumazine synthase n=1 Tax=Gimesia aquarii TaxID=2527964 RepID=A0A517WY99_9PLAN|nr:6,7-dimethyl-8-ribityllumazine synthase [Gimesia aquarii]QDU10229.1 6,7-dimethyl-8-ribityllumazine synthase [Gimesia aquarii]